MRCNHILRFSSRKIKRKFNAKHTEKNNNKQYVYIGRIYLTSIAFYISRSDPPLASYVSIAFCGFMVKCSEWNLHQRISLFLSYRSVCLFVYVGMWQDRSRPQTVRAHLNTTTATKTASAAQKKVSTNGNVNEILVQVANRLAITCRIVTTTLCAILIMPGMTKMMMTMAEPQTERERHTLKEIWEKIGAHSNASITWLWWACKQTEYISTLIFRSFVFLLLLLFSAVCFFFLVWFFIFFLLTYSKPSQLNLRFHRLLWFCKSFFLSFSFILLYSICGAHISFFFFILSLLHSAWFAEWLNDQTLQFHKIKVSK